MGSVRQQCFIFKLQTVIFARARGSHCTNSPGYNIERGSIFGTVLYCTVLYCTEFIPSVAAVAKIDRRAK